MIRTTLRPLLLAACLATPAAAMTDLELMEITTSLGSILASEAFCGLSYDQAAIADFITANVPADRMDFPSQLQMMVMGSEFNQQGLSPSAKTAHCASVTQIARHHGFLK